MSTHNICILGGTGFVGHTLVARLAADGHRILLPTRNRERNRDLLVLPGVSLRTADIHDPATLETLFAGCDVVINLAGILNETRGRHNSFQDVHAELAVKVVAACRQAGVRRLLHMSALRAHAEKAPSKYLRSKGRAEATLRGEAGTGLDWTIFKPSVIFGPDDSFTTRFAGLLRRLPLLLPLARPNARFAPVYVRDVAEAFRRALDNPRAHGETYQLCGPQIYSLREMVTFISEQTGVQRKIIGLPDTLARTQARVMEWLPGKPFSMDNYRSLTVNSICDKNGFARLGIVPRSVEAVAPAYLGRGIDQPRLDAFRREASRNS